MDDKAKKILLATLHVGRLFVPTFLLLFVFRLAIFFYRWDALFVPCFAAIKQISWFTDFYYYHPSVKFDCHPSRENEVYIRWKIPPIFLCLSTPPWTTIAETKTSVLMLVQLLLRCLSRDSGISSEFLEASTFVGKGVHPKESVALKVLITSLFHGGHSSKLHWGGVGACEKCWGKFRGAGEVAGVQRRVNQAPAPKAAVAYRFQTEGFAISIQTGSIQNIHFITNLLHLLSRIFLWTSGSTILAWLWRHRVQACCQCNVPIRPPSSVFDPETKRRSLSTLSHPILCHCY